MKMLVLNPNQLEQLDRLNLSGNQHRQLCTVGLPGPTEALNADVLDDCGPGQTWAHYRTLLQSLTLREVPESDLPTQANHPENRWSVQKTKARTDVLSVVQP